LRARLLAACLAAGIVAGVLMAPPAGAAVTALRATADAYVDRSVPVENFGDARRLRAGAVSHTRSYLRFRLPARAGIVRRVVLRALPSRGFPGGLIVRAVGTERWAELAVADRRAPAIRAVVGRSAALTAERWVSIDVTAAVRRNQRFLTLAISGRGPGQAFLYSRETSRSRAPRLLVTSTVARDTPLDPVVAAAGDIACDPRSKFLNTPNACRDRETSDLLADMDLAALLTLGDTQYEDGALQRFRTIYDRGWGRFKEITRPAVGNHEYLTPGAAGYFDYFNGVGLFSGPAGDRDKGYFSFDVGTWHLIALNSVCDAVGGCQAGSPQEQWLRADLAAHPTRCTLAYWHHPRFSSGQETSSTRFVAFWQALYEAGADVVLAGHAHDYERFAPQTPAGLADPVQGIRQFVVGNGGKFLYDFETPQPNSEARDASSMGVLKLSLRAQGYDWRLVPEARGGFTDGGSGACH
jgi:hypothetical protein